MNNYFVKQSNGYLKYIGDELKEQQLNLFIDYSRYKYNCLKCGYEFINTYSGHDKCLKCGNLKLQKINNAGIV